MSLVASLRLAFLNWARETRVCGSAAEAPVRPLRLVVETDDFEAAVAFYRDVLGMPVELDLVGAKGQHVVILEAGRATPELSKPA